MRFQSLNQYEGAEAWTRKMMREGRERRLPIMERHKEENIKTYTYIQIYINKKKRNQHAEKTN